MAHRYWPVPKYIVSLVKLVQPPVRDWLFWKKVVWISMNFFFFVPRRFMVDWIPIRVYRNHADKGVGFPRWQPMSIKVSLWNGDSWATNGGRDKIDWSKGPFLASFGNYKIDACVWKGNARFCRADSSTNWWNKERFSSLTSTQRRYFK